MPRLSMDTLPRARAKYRCAVRNAIETVEEARREDALRHGNAKFERRYRAMEERAGGRFAALSLDEQEALWQAVKAAE